MKITIHEVHAANDRAQIRKDSVVSRALSVLADPKRVERLKAGVCLACFYLRDGRLVGQAFTKWKCRSCETEDTHHNTGVPKLCVPCSQKLTLCIECLADLDLRPRTKVLRAKKKIR